MLYDQNDQSFTLHIVKLSLYTIKNPQSRNGLNERGFSKQKIIYYNEHNKLMVFILLT